MKLQRLLLISIVANLVCLAGLFWFLSDRKVPAGPSQAAPVAAASAPSQAAPVERVVREVEPFHWSQVEAADYQTYVENLRRIGCPEETIRDLVKQDLDKLYDQRKADILSKSPARKDYWKTGNPSTLSRPSSATSSQMAQLDREKTRCWATCSDHRVWRPLIGRARWPEPVRSPTAAMRWILSRRKPRRN